MAKFTLSIPVFDWGKHGQDVEVAKAQLRSAVLTEENLQLTIEQEITDLIRSLNSSAARVDVLFKSKIVADKANYISARRFDAGTIGQTELSQAQTRFLQARLSALQALIDYNIVLADLTRRTAYDFLNDQPIQYKR
jgi:outer membrane protein TolC